MSITKRYNNTVTYILAHSVEQYELVKTLLEEQGCVVQPYKKSKVINFTCTMDMLIDNMLETYGKVLPYKNGLIVVVYPDNSYVHLVSPDGSSRQLFNKPQ